MKSAIICEQWKFEYSAPPSPRGRELPTTLGRVKTSLGQSQPCPEAEPQPAPGLEPRCPAGLIGLTDHRSADRYPHHGRQSRAQFHCCTVHPITIVLEFRLHEAILHTSNSGKEMRQPTVFPPLSQIWRQVGENHGELQFLIIAGWQRLQPSISGRV